MEFRADLAWADEEGRAGLRFVDLPKKAQEAIEDWMTRQLAMKVKPMSAKPANALSALALKEKW
jgi:hypothetical protein